MNNKDEVGYVFHFANEKLIVLHIILLEGVS